MLLPSVESRESFAMASPVADALRFEQLGNREFPPGRADHRDFPRGHPPQCTLNLPSYVSLCESNCNDMTSAQGVHPSPGYGSIIETL